MFGMIAVGLLVVAIFLIPPVGGAAVGWGIWGSYNWYKLPQHYQESKKVRKICKLWNEIQR